MNGEKKIVLNIDGIAREFNITFDLSLAELLRRENYRGIRRACDGGQCGGCTVLVDKKPVLSCLLMCAQVEGKTILTIDGILTYNDELKILRECFKQTGASQCGFCTCGFIMAAAGLYFENKNPDYNEIITGLSGNLCRCTGYEKIIKAVTDFFYLIKHKKKPAISSAHSEHSPFGKTTEKLEIDGLVSGRALYASDIKLPEQLVMKLALSSKAHAVIKSIDVAAAEKSAGVKLILTHLNTPKTRYTSAAQGYPEPSPYDSRMFDAKVRFFGEPIAAVVADTEKNAIAAIKKISVAYDELPVILNFEDSCVKPVAVIHDECENENINHFENFKKNIAASFHFEQGNIVESDDILTVEGTFETSKQQHAHLEPHCAIAYKDEYKRINIISSTQVPFDVRRITAKILKLPFSMVRVIKPRIGGGFGGKQEILVEGYAAYAASLLDKPVKILLDRKEVFTIGRTRHPFRTDLKIGFNKNTKKIINLRADIVTDTGAYCGHASTVAELAAMRIMSLYPPENICIDIKAVCTNKTPAGAFRGYGEPQIMFALESLIDEAANKLQLCPSELRRLNHIKKGDSLQVETLFIKPFPKGEKIKTCELPILIEHGKTLIDWNFRRKSFDKHIRTGKGMAISMQGSGIANITRSLATVSLNEDGSVQLLTGAVDLGTGADTVLTQIAAQTLGIPMNRIHIITADTAVTPYDSGAYASNTTYFAGEAVMRACSMLKNAVIDWCSQKYGIAGQKIVISNSQVFIGDMNKNISEISEAIFADLKAVDTVFSAAVKKETSAPPFVATFADIDIDIITGKINVVKIVQMLDCGSIVNPALAEGQIEGTTLQAIGYALYENMRYMKSGKLIENDFMAYTIPTIFEKPEIVVEFIQTKEPSGPFGLKAVGEVAYASVAPAINNAVFDAVGKHFYSLPMTPEKFLKISGQ